MILVRAWHGFLIPIPVLGWLLLLAYFLDDRSSVRENRDRAAPAGDSVTRARRLSGLAMDFAPLLLASLLMPPAWAWLIGSGFLLFRDAGPRPLSLGKRVLGLSVCGSDQSSLSYTDSFSRNLPLVLPYLGPLIEGGLVLAGRRRLGDRLAGTAVSQ